MPVLGRRCGPPPRRPRCPGRARSAGRRSRRRRRTPTRRRGSRAGRRRVVVHARGSVPGSGSSAWRRRPAGTPRARSARVDSAARATRRTSRPATPIRRSSEMPPACDGSGCTTATPASRTGLKSQREYSRSPVAIGTVDAARPTPARRRELGQHRFLDEHRLHLFEHPARAGAPCAGETRPWKSIARSRSGRAPRGLAGPVQHGLRLGGRRDRRASGRGGVHLDGGEAGRDLPRHGFEDAARPVAADPASTPGPGRAPGRRAVRGRARRRALPAMSQNAWSIAARARWTTAPGRRGRSHRGAGPARGPRCAAGPGR